VLARILTERNLHKTKVGAVTITCAAVDDVTAWCMLAFVVAIARATGVRPAINTAFLSVAYVLLMFFVVRPFLRRLQAFYERQSRLSQNVVAVIFLLVLISAYTTERIGIHALFGAFLMGAVMPKGTQFVRHLSEKLEDYTVVFLLPIFFAYTGLKTQINLLNHTELWLITLIVIVVACLGKFGGSTLAARACGLDWRESTAIGILMNTRGLMELVILNIGRELGVIHGRGLRDDDYHGAGDDGVDNADSELGLPRADVRSRCCRRTGRSEEVHRPHPRRRSRKRRAAAQTRGRAGRRCRQTPRPRPAPSPAGGSRGLPRGARRGFAIGRPGA
jgi:Kef-type K+ transport system membrane component KefB